MNKRIQELMQQSMVEYQFQHRFSPDKFAELIVRECAEVSKNYAGGSMPLSIVEPTEDSGDEWCVTLKGTAQEIRKHFGVEE